MYTVELPVYNSNIHERFWVAFCMRGGRGINFDGLSLADPEPLFSRKPLVYDQCVLDSQHIGTISVSQPQDVNANILSQEFVELNWTEPEDNGGSPIVRYRLYIQNKDMAGSKLKIETPDNKTTYKLKVPKWMWGKEYVLTVQAINKNRRMSMLSEPAVFPIADPTLNQPPPPKEAPSTVPP